MIPKVIHYCWVGGGPLTPLAKECIESWRVAMPDYEIIEWNQKNFDFSKCEFAVKAFEAKKWAFVADYFRAWVLYNYGGIYLDSDVKVLKTFDPFLNDKFFVGFEEVDVLEADTLGCEKGHPFAKAILDTFESAKFELNKDGSINNICTMPKRITKIFQQRYKVKRFYNRKIELDDIIVYPKSVFSPIEYATKKCKVKKNTVSMHLFNGSWLNNQDNKINPIIYNLKNLTKKALYLTLGYNATQRLIHGKNNDFK